MTVALFLPCPRQTILPFYLKTQQTSPDNRHLVEFNEYLINFSNSCRSSEELARSLKPSERADHSAPNSRGPPTSPSQWTSSFQLLAKFQCRHFWVRVNLSIIFYLMNVARSGVAMVSPALGSLTSCWLEPRGTSEERLVIQSRAINKVLLN